MEIKRSGSQPSGKGPAEYFTGTVRIDPLCNPPAPACSQCQRHLRARGPYRMAHSPAGPDPDRDSRLRQGTALGRTGGGNPAG